MVHVQPFVTGPDPITKPINHSADRRKIIGTFSTRTPHVTVKPVREPLLNRLRQLRQMRHPL